MPRRPNDDFEESESKSTGNKKKDYGPYSKTICERCGVMRFVDAKQYPSGLPTICISCGKRYGQTY